MSPEEKAAKKKADQEAKAALAVSAESANGADDEEEEVTDAELRRLQKRLALSQLRTAEMQEDQAAAVVDKFKADKRTVEQKAKAAQEALQLETRTKTAIIKACRHRQGGFGLEGTLKGKGEPSLIRTTLPIPGHHYIHCYRCGGEWRTPQPSLRRTNPKQYEAELAEFNKIEELYLDSTSTTMGAPVFAFEKDGVPYVPDRV